MIIRNSIFVLLIVMIGGCSFFSDDKNEEVVAPLVDLATNSVHLKEVWSRNVGGLGDDDQVLSLTPAIDGDVIYTVSASGRVMSLDKYTGSVKWSVKLDKAITSAVGASDGFVAVADREGGIYTLNSLSGDLLWRAQASSEVLAAPAINEDVVIVQAVDSRVQAFDAKTGVPRWVYSASQSVLSLRGNAAPVIQGGSVYVAFDNGKAASIDAQTGLLRWEQRFIIPDGRSELERVIDVQADPLLVGGDVLIGAYQGSVVSLDSGRGQPRWEQKASVAKSMAQSEGTLFFVESTDVIKALRIEGGREAWKSEIYSGRKLSAPAIVGDYVAVADKEGYIHLLTQADGVYSGRYSVGGNGVRVNLLSNGALLFVLANNGKLEALQIEK